jgi:hypothetical protein
MFTESKKFTLHHLTATKQASRHNTSAKISLGSDLDRFEKFQNSLAK